ncbi:hypothetical protein [Thalassospira povalilytica]|uniref:hypothetical protein n=1 Tax=Thalassospira povalilytica TaxID=732237 RepID=UPI001D191039|nr:hypothetical protein [Thalassospira povalilytica]MCC4238811.1 hypothetical protein [Thalassospira povalilytica]
MQAHVQPLAFLAAFLAAFSGRFSRHLFLAKVAYLLSEKGVMNGRQIVTLADRTKQFVLRSLAQSINSRP